MREFDTICAIATPIGEGGVAIIRISGEKALDIANIPHRVCYSPYEATQFVKSFV